MQNNYCTEMNILDVVRKNADIVNDILSEQNLNAQNLKEALYNFTSDIRYKKNIGDIYYFYFNQKDKALEYYLDYVSKIHTDSSVYHIISMIFKSKKDNINYKKYLELALNSLL